MTGDVAGERAIGCAKQILAALEEGGESYYSGTTKGSIQV